MPTRRARRWVPPKPGGDAQAHFRLAEHGVVGAETDVAAHGQLVAAAQRKAVDSRDDGQREALDHQEDVIAHLAEGFALGLGHGGHGADVRTGDKALVTCAGQHDAADGVLVDALKGGLQVGQDFGVQRVERLGTVDGDDGHRALHFSSYKRH